MEKKPKENCDPVCRTNPVSIPVAQAKPSGAGTARGTGAATKGKNFGGEY